MTARKRNSWRTRREEGTARGRRWRRLAVALAMLAISFGASACSSGSGGHHHVTTTTAYGNY